MAHLHNHPIAPLPKNLRVVFFGSSKYSVIVKKALTDKFGLALVVTAPDKPSGRKRKLTPTPVKEFALKNKILLITPAKLDKEAIENIANAQPDFLVACDYGLILPPELLKLPKYDALNVHHSLLPKYRGPTPAPSAILAGEEKTGVTIISMTEEVDTGDILAQKEYTLNTDETTDSLLTQLNRLGGQLIIKIIENYLAGSVKKIKQDDSKATYTHRLKKADGEIDLQNPPDPLDFDRMIRAYYPWPGTWCRLMVNGKSLIVKLLPPTIPPAPARLASESVAGRHQPNSPFLIQPEGKRVITITEFKNGYPQAYEQISRIFKNKV